ncbi:hypothetical protein [Yinghuangia sp. YIM S09857]|uniref:hypothetical protein n=1 Tax=Yinghuangia sp. YIM S09857 TaxID=3436929 RepID=UPI003F52C710
MAEIEVPQDLIDLKCAVGKVAMALSKHMRANGPAEDWSPEAVAEGIALQRAWEQADAAFKHAVEGTAYARPGGDRAARMALTKAAVERAERDRVGRA